MRQLIKSGKVYFKQGTASRFVRKDIVITNNRITDIIDVGKYNNDDRFDKIIDATNCLVIPGLINAHLHSHDHFNKARFDNLPLELWMPSLRPMSTGITHSEDEIYLRTLYGCIEMLKTGTTTIIDDVLQQNIYNEKKIDAVLRAYDKAGIRGYITTMTSDKNLYDTVPYLNEYFTEDQKKAFSLPSLNVRDICDFQEGLIKSRISKIMKYAISLSAPQRCTESLFIALSELAKKYKVPAVCHVLETKVQAVTGQKFYGKSLLQYMKDIGALHEYFNLIHTVHVTTDEIEIMRESKCKMVHNPVSNLKLGSGIAPLREIVDAGISVGLGTDNTSCNDSINMFETMKFAATIHKISTCNYEKWIGAEDAFKMATIGGAACALMADEIGKIEIGRKADIVIIDVNNYEYVPSSNLLNSMVFCDRGNRVKHVIIDGVIVVENGNIKTFDEKGVMSEIKNLLPKIMKENKRARIEIAPYLENIRKAYMKACLEFELQNCK